MKRILSLFLMIFLIVNVTHAASRLKDLIKIKGVRSNPLIGYGIVVGLNGTGDGGGEISGTSLKQMFKKLGLNLKKELNSKNIAAVVVTSKMPTFGRLGQKLDVTVSSVGDASSLAGGTLLVTPLRAGDDKVYAVADGALSIGGLKQGSKFPTTGRIVGGATIERELGISFDKKKALRLSLNNPDFTTAARIEKVINTELGGKYATARDSSTVDLIVPISYQRKLIQLIAIIENFKVNQDRIAKIVINERTGTIVSGGDILLSPVAISHGNLVIETSGSSNTTGANGNIFMLKKETRLNELVKSLNVYGVTPEDLISILQTLKRNGALVGEVELI